GSMFAITPVASALTRLPASPEHPGCTAGMSFATVRGSSAVPAGASTDHVLVERARELAERAAKLEAESAPRLTGAGGPCAGLARALQAGLSSAAAAPSTAVSSGWLSATATESGATAVPTSIVADGVETVEGKALTLLFEGKRCIHSRHCVL